MGVKIFENRRIFVEDMDKSLRLTFLGHPVCNRIILVLERLTPNKAAPFWRSHCRQQWD